eukprot:TRINITY_DN35746_c0_g1_i1.p1 TRINITY_DN35746_c0_g1~~TRINITY_DN35746_c0_g1_i1.p1  ORF type:complete len:394 (-),score=74.22 TRINITY_DN35746_c0_g1_i1:27-1208(-)
MARGRKAVSAEASRSEKPSVSQTQLLPEPPEGWTRYFDPESERTYLYCEASGDWYFEESNLHAPEVHNPSASSWPFPAVGSSGKAQKVPAALDERPRPSANQEGTARTSPSQAAALQEESSVGGAGSNGNIEFASEHPEVVELAKQDPIVRDLVRDEMRLRKKLREIQALEVLDRKPLEASQLAKISKKDSILADLKMVSDHIMEALREFQKTKGPACQPTSANSAVKATLRTKPVSKAAKQVATVDPLPQRGKAPMKVNPNLGEGYGNSASRLAAFAPPATSAVRPSVSCAVQEEAVRPTRNLSMADYMGYSAAVQPQQPVAVTSHANARPPAPPIPGAFTQVAARSKQARQKPLQVSHSGLGSSARGRGRGTPGQLPSAATEVEDDDDAFW